MMLEEKFKKGDKVVFDGRVGVVSHNSYSKLREEHMTSVLFEGRRSPSQIKTKALFKYSPDLVRHFKCEGSEELEKTLIKIAEEYGYKQVVTFLQNIWQQKLVDAGLDPTFAFKYVNNGVPYKRM